jgi:hypothetical protein
VRALRDDQIFAKKVKKEKTKESFLKLKILKIYR